MGIDARILVRNVPVAVVTDEWLKQTSWLLCQSVGAENFYVDDGTEWGRGRTAVSRSIEYDERGDAIEAKDGECLLRVNLKGRYYGRGYERGDLMVYCLVAEWFERNIPDCEVWYGGDSSGVCVEPWPEVARAELRAHLLSSSGREYFNHRTIGHGSMAKKPPACLICPGGEYRGSQYGFGGCGQYAAFSCAGCGKKAQTNDGGSTWSFGQV